MDARTASAADPLAELADAAPVEHLQAIRLRAYPNKVQAARLEQWFGACRFLWNAFVAYNAYKYDLTRKASVQKTGVPKGEFAFGAELSKAVTEIKKIEGYEWLSDIPAMCLTSGVVPAYERALKTALKARKQGGIRRGFPTFHRKRQGEGSIYLHNQMLRRITKDVDQPGKARGAITIAKLGAVRVRDGRWPHGRILGGRLTQHGGQFHIVLQFQAKPLWPAAAPEVEAIGVDLGLKSFAAIATGPAAEDVTLVKAPKYLRKAERRLKRVQRALSRAQKGSNRRKRKIARLMVLHRQVANQRANFLHNLSHQVTAKAAVIGLEDLNVQAMTGTRLAKSVHDAGMAEFKRQVEYKANWRGRTVVQLDRWQRSTGVCPDCAAVTEQRLKLHVRSWTCPACGAAHDRDGAAARVIRRHVVEMVGACGPDPRSVDRPGGKARGEAGAGRHPRVTTKPALVKRESAHSREAARMASDGVITRRIVPARKPVAAKDQPDTQLELPLVPRPGP